MEIKRFGAAIVEEVRKGERIVGLGARKGWLRDRHGNSGSKSGSIKGGGKVGKRDRQLRGEHLVRLVAMEWEGTTTSCWGPCQLAATTLSLCISASLLLLLLFPEKQRAAASLVHLCGAGNGVVQGIQHRREGEKCMGGLEQRTGGS